MMVLVLTLCPLFAFFAHHVQTEASRARESPTPPTVTLLSMPFAEKGFEGLHNMEGDSTFPRGGEMQPEGRVFHSAGGER